MRTFLRASSLVGVAALVAVLCSPLQVRTAETRTPLVRADHFDAAEDRTSECVSGPPPWTHVALWIAPDADAGHPVDVRRKLSATLARMSFG